MSSEDSLAERKLSDFVPVLKKDVEFVNECVGPEVEKKVNAASNGQV